MRKALLVILGSVFLGGASVQAQPVAPLPPAPAPSIVLVPEAAPLVYTGGEPPETMWFRSEFLLWKPRGAPLPPLVTSSPAGTAQAAAGILGPASTTVLVGNERASNDVQPGARFTLGRWVNADQTLGVEVSYFFLCIDSASFAVSSNGIPPVSRPFFDALNNAQAAELVGFPGILNGRVGVVSDSDCLQGAEALVRRNLTNSDDGTNAFRLDLLGGFRFLGFHESLGIREDLVSTNAAGVVPQGTQILVQDSFRTANDFYGGEFGLSSRIQRGAFTLELLGKVALGDTRETVHINGSRTNTTPDGTSASASGGLLALASNIGNYGRDVFAVVPELGVNVGVQVTPWARAYAGYTWIYWTSVVRPGDQIDLSVNPNLIPPTVQVGPNRPAFDFHASEFWVHGVQFGLELTY